ncbi:hypothetical protein QVD17_39220 [Tagetes erecta]|uniref:Cathepsin propeptide inhibitor domain-containing protein n=1 Tax=Tagetes erecta TaxID=13708 RepID=A0AAD8JN53_TARER|nr:hypothetical protein QVD17_39220 [Tagetes erecta]
MTASDEADMKRFEEWMKKYNKQYPTQEEKELRFDAFKIYLHHVDSYLAQGFTGKALDRTSDMTPYELFTLEFGYDLDARMQWGSDSDDDDLYTGTNMILYNNTKGCYSLRADEGESESEDEDEDEDEVSVKRQRSDCSN